MKDERGRECGEWRPESGEWVEERMKYEVGGERRDERKWRELNRKPKGWNRRWPQGK
jgi:hypothetical protein